MGGVQEEGQERDQEADRRCVVQHVCDGRVRYVRNLGQGLDQLRDRRVNSKGERCGGRSDPPPEGLEREYGGRGGHPESDSCEWIQSVQVQQQGSASPVDRRGCDNRRSIALLPCSEAMQHEHAALCSPGETPIGTRASEARPLACRDR